MSVATVLYGDGKSLLFNTNCRNICLLYDLRQKCNEVCSENDKLDLATEKGECKNLSKHLDAYACDYISHRERMVLIKIEGKFVSKC